MTKINMCRNELSFKKGAKSNLTGVQRLTGTSYATAATVDPWMHHDDTYAADYNYGVLFGPARRSD